MKPFDAFAFAVLALSMITCAPVIAKDRAADANRPCMANYTNKGGGLRGKIHSTWQEYKGMEYDTVFRKVAQATAAVGWGEMTATKDIGTITAGQQGANINISINEKDDGVIRVEANITIGPLVGYAESVAKKAMCKSVEAPAM